MLHCIEVDTESDQSYNYGSSLPAMAYTVQYAVKQPSFTQRKIDAFKGEDECKNVSYNNYSNKITSSLHQSSLQLQHFRLSPFL